MTTKASTGSITPEAIDTPRAVPRKKWLVRSVSLPVQRCLSHKWGDFCKLLHGCWRHSTDLANWASHTLTRLDVTRTPGMTELPPWDRPDLYARAFGRSTVRQSRERVKCGQCARSWFSGQVKDGVAPEHRRGKAVCPGSGRPAAPVPRNTLPVVPQEYDAADFWAGAKIAAQVVLRKVASKYARERGKIVWRRERRSPEFVYPYPFPVHQDAWVPMFDGSGRPVVNVALPGGRVSLQLRGGPEFAAALRVFARLVEGDVAQQEISITRVRGEGSVRPTAAERGPSGAHREFYRVMVRIAYRAEVHEGFGEGLTADLRTGPDPLLALSVAGSHEWLLHAPWVRNWVVEHRRFLDAFADDLKHEKRWPAAKRRGLNRYRERRCEKHACRMKSFVQQTAAQVVGHAGRRKVSRLRYDDSDRSFAARDFPWFALRERLQQKCDEAGIVLEVVAPEPVTAEGPCLGPSGGVNSYA